MAVEWCHVTVFGRSLPGIAIHIVLVVVMGVVLASCGGQRARVVELTDEEQALVEAARLARQPRGCPVVEIRRGTNYYPIYVRGYERDPQRLRYQATIRETARECQFTETALTMRVGILGRILIGPAGVGGGTLTLPLRIVVSRGDEVITSNIREITVTMEAGVASMPFTHVEENVVIERQPGDTGANFTVIAGFDPEGRR